MEKETTKAVQACELDILQKIDHICRRHGLSWFGIGGTALGAVRHGGFIPWDDDIDIGMPRRDYEIFLSAAREELPQGYHLQHFSTEPNSPFYFAKVRKDGTVFEEYYLRGYPIHQGIFVDIFPFDPVPEQPILDKIHFKIGRGLYQLFLAKSLNTVCSSRFAQLGEEKRTWKHQVRRLLHILLTPVPKKWLFGALDRWSRLLEGRETRRIGHIVRRRLSVDLRDLHPIRELPFDRGVMRVPGNTEVYLTNQFGEHYMELPPEEQRFGHLPYRVEV